MTIRDLTVALAPVREGLLRRARSEADRVGAEAAAEEARVLSDARARAAGMLGEARAKGEADAAAVRAAELVRAHRAARSITLTARRMAYEELRRRVADELGRRCADPQVRAVLADRVRQVLGPPARVTDDPRGGVVGSVDGRRVDYTSDALAAGVVEALAEEVEELWRP